MASLPVVEHFQRYALERRVCRDGANPTENRVKLLGDLLLHARLVNRALKLHGVQMDKAAAKISESLSFSSIPCLSSEDESGMSNEFGDGNAPFEEESNIGKDSEELGSSSRSRSAMEREAMARALQVDGAVSKAAALHCMVLELILTIVLEVELEASVQLLESLKFWRQLAQMHSFQRRVYYPALHWREGGIRRTALRRAARLEAMLADRTQQAGTLHALLLTVRTLPDAVISNHPAAVADAAPIPASPPSPQSVDQDVTSNKKGNYSENTTTTTGGDGYRDDDNGEPQPLHRATAKQLDEGSRPSDLFLAELGRLWQQAEVLVGQVVCDTESEAAAAVEFDARGGSGGSSASSREGNMGVAAAKSKVSRKRAHQISTSSSSSVKTGAAESSAEASWFEHVRKLSAGMSYDESLQTQQPPSPKLHSSPVNKHFGGAATARAGAAQSSSSSLDERTLESPSPSPPPPSTSPQPRAQTPRTHYWAPRVPRQPIPSGHLHTLYVDNDSNIDASNGHLGGSSGGTKTSNKGSVSFEDLESAVEDEFAFGNFGLFDGNNRSQDSSLQAPGSGEESRGNVQVPLAAPRPTRGVLQYDAMHSMSHRDSSQSGETSQIEANLNGPSRYDGGHASVIGGAAAVNNPWAHEAQAGASLASRGPQLMLLGKRVIAHARAAPTHTARVMGTAAQPSRLTRLWPWYCAYACALVGFAGWGVRHRAKVAAFKEYLTKNVKAFLQEHVVTPAREIIDEVVFNRRTRITDVAELEESRQSLKRALHSFMAALKQPVLSEEEVKQRSEALDMSLATRKFEADISSGGTAAYHLVTGEMARVLLLQVLFIKKELLVAMSAIEDLMDANNFNFRVMATVPAFLMGAASIITFRQLRSWLVGHHTSEETYASMRTLLLDIERALSREAHHSSHETPTAATGGHFSSFPATATTTTTTAAPSVHGDVSVNTRKEGLLLTLLWRLRRLALVVQRSGRISRNDAHALHSDLDDLAHGGLDSGARLAAAVRMAPSYRFLRRTLPNHSDSAYPAAYLK